MQPLTFGWEFRSPESESWLPAQVPGHVHLDLIRNGIISNPNEKLYEQSCQWVDERDWEYRTAFHFSPSPNLPRVILRFEGLDTIATVLLNGKKIAESESMFVPLEADITHQVKEGENVLTVRFQSAVKTGNKRKAAYFKQEGIGSKTAGFEERAFVRKAPYMSGWDWGPRLVSCGIWKPVTLICRAENEVSSAPSPSAAPMAQLIRNDDEFGQSFEFHQNGRRLWIRGANWIPDTSFPSEINPQRLERILDACHASKINMLRVWGGGLYESDLFYELCRERNILVWQDFLFACSYYPESEEFLKRAASEAREAILRLRKHPNLVLWCGNNENHTMWDAPWHHGDARPDRFYGKIIYEEILPRLVQELDPDRPYIPSSPIGGNKANDDGIGDNHVWDVWHGRGDWRFYEESKSRFASEFGFASAPCMKTWSETLTSTDVAPDHPEVRGHDKTGKPWDVYRGMVELHYPKAETLQDWVYYSQLNQRDAMKAALEHYRRSDFCAGTLIWQANDCWPVQSWSLFDFEARPKAAAFELKRIHDNLLISLQRDKTKVHVHLINDGTADAWGELRIRAVSLESGEMLREEKCLQAASAGSRQRVTTFDLSGLNTRTTLLWAEYGPVNAWSLLVDPKLAAVPEPQPIGIKLEADILTLMLESPVVDLMLTSDGDPTPFESNFITSPAGGELSVRLKQPVSKIELRSLAGHHPVRF